MEKSGWWPVIHSIHSLTLFNAGLIKWWVSLVCLHSVFKWRIDSANLLTELLRYSVDPKLVEQKCTTAGSWLWLTSESPFDVCDWIALFVRLQLFGYN